MKPNKKKTWTSAALACALLAAATWAPTAAAAKDDVPVYLKDQLKKTLASPELTKASLKHGGKVAGFCAHCHGENGNSLHPDTPNLAGQNPSYLLDQMLKFGSGQRKHEFMQRLINVMSPEEKVGTALYFTRQQVTTQSTGSAAVLKQGKAHYDSVCFRCHGADGMGNETLARLAGQQERYVIYALKRYRDGSAIRQDPLMAESTRNMSDQDIAAVAAYVASMK